MIDPRRAYAGIGSRKTPEDILAYMTAAATQLSYHNLVLRSGGADGADMAFEQGVPDPDNKQIFLPWKGFNGNQSKYHEPSYEARSIAMHYHPVWQTLTGPVQNLMARNVHQVLGAACNDPVLFVLCWAPEGSGKGGTGQAIRIARNHRIPVFDMGSMSLDEIENQIALLIT